MQPPDQERILRESLVEDPAVGQRLGSSGRQSLVENRWTWEGNAERVVGYARELGAKESA